MRIKIKNWLLEVDIAKTQEFYNKGIEVCDCLYCRNFVIACKVLDTSLETVFKKIGINPAMPSHLSDFPATEEGIREYMGNYHLVGRVLEGEFCTTSTWMDTNTVQIQNFRLGFSKDLEFVPKGFPKPVLQLDFAAKMPWVLNEQPDDL